jgi:hypothetical protein
MPYGPLTIIVIIIIIITITTTTLPEQIPPLPFSLTSGC